MKQTTAASYCPHGLQNRSRTPATMSSLTSLENRNIQKVAGLHTTNGPTRSAPCNLFSDPLQSLPKLHTPSLPHQSQRQDARKSSPLFADGVECVVPTYHSTLSQLSERRTNMYPCSHRTRSQRRNAVSISRSHCTGSFLHELRFTP